MGEFRQTLQRAAVIPVVTLDRAEHALPLARTLFDAGLDVLELTLRTPAALEALALIAEAMPGVTVGVGTVLDPRQLQAARVAGARFAVSPGLDPALLHAARSFDIPLLPGVMTPSEAMQARALGCDLLKLFPADVAGGIAWLRAVAPVLPELAFCPTGGVDAANCAAYLAEPNVLCVGGSWVAPRRLIAAADWAAIGRLAAQAATRRMSR